MGDNDPQPAKISFEADFLAERKKNIELTAQFEDLQGRYKSQGERLSRLSKKAGEQSEPKPEPPAPAQEPKAPPEPKPAPASEEKLHGMSITDAFCPECRKPNPDFKDETECKNCGRELGAIATLSKVQACPKCGLSKMPDGTPLARKRQAKALEVPKLG